jgi:small subunit ribosomal protein S16
LYYQITKHKILTMAVKLRLARRGRAKAPFYHIVVADSRSPRDGKYIESIGSYNPLTVPATIELDREKAYDWLVKGAQPTDTVAAILRFKGVLMKKHLMRGVKKGALTPEQADAKLVEWIDAKEAKIAARVTKTSDEKAAFRKLVDGSSKAPKVVAAPAVDQAAFREDAPADATVAEEAPAVEEAPVTVVEETPVAEAPAAEAPADETAE